MKQKIQKHARILQTHIEYSICFLSAEGYSIDTRKTDKNIAVILQKKEEKK